MVGSGFKNRCTLLCLCCEELLYFSLQMISIQEGDLYAKGRRRIVDIFPHFLHLLIKLLSYGISAI